MTFLGILPSNNPKETFCDPEQCTKLVINDNHTDYNFQEDEEMKKTDYIINPINTAVTDTKESLVCWQRLHPQKSSMKPWKQRLLLLLHGVRTPPLLGPVRTQMAAFGHVWAAERRCSDR